MTDYTYSIVLIVPAAQQAKANALAEAMGWGPDNYNIPISADGSEPATHYGLVTVCTAEFLAMLSGAEGGELPVDFPPEDLAEIIDNLIASHRPGTNAGGAVHLAEVLAGNGLAILEGEYP